MSIYKVIQVVGSSQTSWEEAAQTAISESAKHLRDLRIAEIDKLDVRLEDNKIVEYRARLNISFRYEGE